MSKVCVITGGGSGMGLEAAKLLGKERIVVISGRTEAKLQKACEELKESGCQAHYFICDTSKRESVKQLVEFACSLGDVTNVINSAGLSPNMSDPETILRVNALGTVYVNEEFSKVMKANTVILDVASNSAYVLPSFLINKKVYTLADQDEQAFLKKMLKKTKLAKEGYFDGTLFHRVIKDFMIQGGDPDSKGAPAGKNLGTGGPDYTIPAEFVYPQLFHKRGALSAARLGDEVNPKRESSGSQFYIVWGKKYKAAELKQMERQLAMQQEQAVFNQLVAENKSKIMELRRSRDRAGLQELQDELIATTKAMCSEKGAPAFTAEQQQAYTTIGGTPFLDNQYTVFGEVEEGLDIVEKIQEVETLRNDRPKEDVVMMEVRVI